MDRDYIIEVEQLSFAYEMGQTALDQVDLKLERGKITTLLGSNGAGKSTLFLNLNGILKPSAGRILFEGEPLIYDKAGLLRMRKNVGIVFQDPDDQLFSADVYRDISFGAVNLGLPKEEVARRTEQAMQQVGISALRDRPTHALSYGQKKRVAIAGVLVMEPQVIILDEPTAGLDPEGVSEILQLLRTLNRERGITIVMATHDMDLIADFSDAVYVLRAGRVMASGDPRSIFADPKLLEENQLRLPIISTLMQRLAEAKLDVDASVLTIDEAVSEIERLVRAQREA